MNLMSELRKIPGLAPFIDAADAGARASRKALTDELEALTGRLPRAIAVHDRKIGPLARRLEDARTAFIEAERQLTAARRDQSTDLHQIRHRIDAIEGKLRAGADPRIGQARAAMAAEWEHHRHYATRVDEIPTESFNADTGRRVVTQRSNARAVVRLVTAIRQAHHHFDALELAAVEDVDAAIAELLAPVKAAYAQLATLEPVAR